MMDKMSPICNVGQLTSRGRRPALKSALRGDGAQFAGVGADMRFGISWPAEWPRRLPLKKQETSQLEALGSQAFTEAL
jgi:hypothetical protein